VEEVRVVANNFSAVDGRTSERKIQSDIENRARTSFTGRVYYFQNNTLLRTANSNESAGVPPQPVRLEPSASGDQEPDVLLQSFEGLRQSGARGAVARLKRAVSAITFEEPAEHDRANLFQQFKPLTDPSYNYTFSAGAARGDQAAPPRACRSGQRGFVPDTKLSQR